MNKNEEGKERKKKQQKGRWSGGCFGNQCQHQSVGHFLSFPFRVTGRDQEGLAAGSHGPLLHSYISSKEGRGKGSKGKGMNRTKLKVE